MPSPAYEALLMLEPSVVVNSVKQPVVGAAAESMWYVPV
jgi:hypothetical protein